MDCKNVGKLIYDLRKEKNLTQKQLADKLNISDKTVSKWERGLGCPDVSLLNNLSEILGVNVDKILIGKLEENDDDGGNMKKTKFYVCPICGSTITSTGESTISCCGRNMEPLTPKKADDKHNSTVELIENDFYITFDHEMKKEHYISFVAYVCYDRVLFIRLYPEQQSEVRFPRTYRGKLYFYCTKDGLWVRDL